MTSPTPPQEKPPRSDLSIAKDGNRLPLNPSKVFHQFPVRQRRVFNRLSKLCPELCEMEAESNTEVSDQGGKVKRPLLEGKPFSVAQSSLPR